MEVIIVIFVLKENNDNFHSKLFALFNIKTNIIFLWRWTVHVAESYYDPEDASSWLFEKDGT